MTEVSPEFELGLNCVMHSLIIFTALVILFAVLISKTEEHALQGEVKSALNANLTKALEKGNESSNGRLKQALKAIDPALEIYEKTVQGPDEATTVYNNGLYVNAYLIVGILLTTLVVMSLVMAYGAGVSVRSALLAVFLSNLVIFSVVGAIEFTFFTRVASKFIPIRPSVITTSILDSIKGAVAKKPVIA